LHGDVHGLKALRERYIAANPDVASELAEYFKDEDAVGDSFGRPADRLPRFERYADIALIGRGAMGVVYKAFDRELKRWVALKVPSVEVAMSGDRQRLRAEAENLARLTHHHIVRVFDVAEHDGHTVISMELIEGGSLHEHADRFRHDSGRWRRSWWRSPGRCTTRTSAGFCTAISSRQTFCSAATLRRSAPIRQ
jgi:serine/threonine protein kinase